MRARRAQRRSVSARRRTGPTPRHGAGSALLLVCKAPAEIQPALKLDHRDDPHTSDLDRADVRQDVLAKVRLAEPKRLRRLLDREGQCWNVRGLSRWRHRGDDRNWRSARARLSDIVRPFGMRLRCLRTRVAQHRARDRSRRRAAIGPLARRAAPTRGHRSRRPPHSRGSTSLHRRRRPLTTSHGGRRALSSRRGGAGHSSSSEARTKSMRTPNQLPPSARGATWSATRQRITDPAATLSP